MVNLECMVKSLRLAWLKRIFRGLKEHGKANYNRYWAPLGDCSLWTATTISRITQILLSFYQELLLWWSQFRETFAAEEDGIQRNISRKQAGLLINIMLVRESFAFKIFYLVRTVLIFIINCLKKYAKQIFLNGLAHGRSIPLSLRSYDRYPSIISPTFVVGDNVLMLRKGNQRVTTPNSSEKKPNHPICSKVKE